jgi:hypothetical protein
MRSSNSRYGTELVLIILDIGCRIYGEQLSTEFLHLNASSFQITMDSKRFEIISRTPVIQQAGKVAKILIIQHRW